MYKIPKGTIDYYGNKLNFIKNKLSNIYEKYGGEYLETPVFELKNMIMGKYGEEAENKLVYNIEDNGGEKLVLRYDLTIPFIRYLKENNIKKIKRYSIGKVYRRDNPNISNGRYREFYQADFDIIGENNDSMLVEATIIKMITEILSSFNFNNYRIIINDTDNLKEIIINQLNVDEKDFKNICSTIDKLDKVSFMEIIPELQSKGLNMLQIEKLQTILLTNKMENSKIDKLVNICKLWNIDDKINVDLSLARGLDYYNGIIFEVKLDNFDSSIIAGGRYDNLIPNTTMIGFSVGLTRLYNLINLENNNKWSNIYNFTTLGDIVFDDKIKIIKYIQDNISHNNKLNFSFDKDKKLTKLIGECAKKYEKYIIILSEEEFKNNKLIIKDLENNTQFLHDIKN